MRHFALVFREGIINLNLRKLKARECIHWSEADTDFLVKVYMDAKPDIEVRNMMIEDDNKLVQRMVANRERIRGSAAPGGQFTSRNRFLPSGLSNNEDLVTRSKSTRSLKAPRFE